MTDATPNFSEGPGIGPPSRNGEAPNIGRVDAVFVYGTLLRGELRDWAWAGHTILCAVMATTQGHLHATDDDYPAVVQAPDAGHVHGDLIRVANIDRLLTQLDQIEEFRPDVLSDQLFMRVLTSVSVGGTTCQAWMYVAGGLLQPGPRIESGSWRQHLGRTGQFLGQLADHHAARLQGRRWQDLLECDPTRAPPEMSLAQAMTHGQIDEFRLAQASGCWNALT